MINDKNQDMSKLLEINFGNAPQFGLQGTFRFGSSKWYEAFKIFTNVDNMIRGLYVKAFMEESIRNVTANAKNDKEAAYIANAVNGVMGKLERAEFKKAKLSIDRKNTVLIENARERTHRMTETLDFVNAGLMK